MKLLVVLCGLLLTVSASPLLGTEQCARGPVVWCENIQTAYQCGAVKHCQQTVWNKPTVKSLPCDICKKVVTVLGNFLKDNCTESEAQQFLHKMCELVPDPTITSMCKNVVDTYFPLLYDMLEQALENPCVACQALHFCQSLQQYLASLKPPQHLQTNKIPESELVYPFISKVLQKPKTGDICKDCVSLVTEVQDMFRSNSSSHTLVDKALKECDELGIGLSDMCKMYVNLNLKLVVGAVMLVPAQQICSLFVCGETQVLTPAELIPAMKIEEASVPPDSMCIVCKLVVKELDRLLEGKRTKPAVLEALEKVCHNMPGTYRHTCDHFIEVYRPDIIHILEQDVIPILNCHKRNICSHGQSANIELNPVVETSGGDCEICKLAVKYMERILSKNATQERILEELEKFCHYLPDSVQTQCSDMVSEYVPLLMQIFLQMLNPDLVCQKLGMCPCSKPPLLGTDKCTQGPSYWCKDMSTAAICNAVEHCKCHVWL